MPDRKCRPLAIARGSVALGLLVLVAVVPASAEVNQSWTQLMDSLKAGEKIVVIQMNGKKVEGKLGSLSEESITLTFREVVPAWRDEYRDATVTVKREDVFRVRIADIRQKRTLLGMAIGAGAGAVLLGAREMVKTRTNEHVRGMAVAGAIFGLGFGAATGGVLPIGAPLYEAPGGLKRK